MKNLCFLGGSCFKKTQKKIAECGIFKESNIWAKVDHIQKIEA